MARLISPSMLNAAFIDLSGLEQCATAPCHRVATTILHFPLSPLSCFVLANPPYCTNTLTNIPSFLLHLILFSKHKPYPIILFKHFNSRTQIHSHHIV
ncbi:hypothetical protein OWV82_006738 [Melia azedarach]|uniref:Uncharacterized protein n=1 Tax=Melia azedarach TaxID=155640 RepID=A0ACC1YHR8_MELAZ|nr:hypothetical protein OWV82_006738 [Melia azedarach]